MYYGSELPGLLGEVVNSGRHIKDGGKQGFLTYGPYAVLPEGRYTFDICYSSKNAYKSKFDIVTNSGNDIIKEEYLIATNPFYNIVKNVSVPAEKANQQWEVRVWYAGVGELTIHYIKITKKTGLAELPILLKYFFIIFIVMSLIYVSYRYSKSITLFFLFLIFLLSLSLVLSALSKFYDYRALTYKEMPLTKDIFKYFLNESIKGQVMRLKAKPFHEDHKLDTYSIMIDKAALDTLNEDLPESGMEQYVDARLKINDELNSKIKLRYRGGSHWNYCFKRKSLKLKFSGYDSYKMDKVINLSKLYAPELFVEPISQRLAQKAGLLAPNVKIIKLFFNGEYAGLYLYLEQIDESFLRKHKLMPGSIYDGDYSYKASVSVDKEGIPNLWRDSTLWEKKSARNAEQKDIREDIDLLITAVNSYSKEDFRKFVDTYFAEDYFKYLAFDEFTGTPHHDYYHNHKVYFDPYKGKFHPISWDIRFWTPDKIKDMSYNPLVERFALDPQLDYKRDKELFKLLQTITIKDIKKEIDTEKEKIASGFAFDKEPRKLRADRDLFPYLECLYPQQLVVASLSDIYSTYDRYFSSIQQRLQYLKTLLNNTTVKYTLKEEKDSVLISYLVEGNSPVELSTKEILYSGRKRVSVPKVAPLTGKTNVIHTPQLYTLRLKKSDFSKTDFLSGTNAVTGKKIIFEEVLTLPNIQAINLNEKTPELTKTVVLKDKIFVNKTLVFDKKTNVIIEPGTTFILAPKVSIYFYAKVTALGTKEHPIQFMAKDVQNPWGLVAVQGKATSNSQFAYCYFENGSVDTHNLIHYTSQFNIHDSKNFSVQNCKIGRNFIGDDAMHIAYSTGVVDRTTYIDARSDALDVDISTVTVKNCTFINSGNDALDVMTTQLIADNNTFIDMGDKGISVGEWSNATITNSTFTRTLIGIEIKDKSKVTASNLKFIDTKEKAINLYNKNSRYNEGGYLRAKNLSFSGNSTIKADNKSKVVIDE